MASASPRTGNGWTLVSWIWLFLPQVLSTRFNIGTPAERNQPAITAPGERIPLGLPGFDGFDPSAQILCVGKFPPELAVPRAIVAPNNDLFPSLFRQYANVRDLCARPVYGGSLSAFSAGGYCASGVSPPTVVFQHLPPGGVHMSEDMKKIYLFCQQRCRCVTGDFASLLSQGRPAAQIAEEEAVISIDQLQFPSFYRISAQLPPRAALYSRYPDPSWGSPIPVYFVEEREGRNIGSVATIGGSAAVVTVWIPPFDGYSSPQCVGLFENPFSIPGHSPASAQQICAATWYGGSKRGNVGYVCQRVLDGSDISVTTEKSIQHPVYADLYVNSEYMHIYQDTMRQCFLACTCPPLEDTQEPFRHKTTISTMLGSLYDASKTILDDLQRGGRSSDASTSLDQFGIPDHGHLALGELCRTNSVDGFDLEGSLTTQALCRRLVKLKYRRRRHD